MAYGLKASSYNPLSHITKSIWVLSHFTKDLTCIHDVYYVKPLGSKLSLIFSRFILHIMATFSRYILHDVNIQWIELPQGIIMDQLIIKLGQLTTWSTYLKNSQIMHSALESSQQYARAGNSRESDDANVRNGLVLLTLIPALSPFLLMWRCNLNKIWDLTLLYKLWILLYWDIRIFLSNVSNSFQFGYNEFKNG